MDANNSWCGYRMINDTPYKLNPWILNLDVYLCHGYLEGSQSYAVLEARSLRHRVHSCDTSGAWTQTSAPSARASRRLSPTCSSPAPACAYCGGMRLDRVDAPSPPLPKRPGSRSRQATPPGVCRCGAPSPHASSR